MVRPRLSAVAAWLLAASSLAASSGPLIVGNVRVTPLADTLVRLEARGPKGFEDRPTFTVVSRHWSKVSWTESRSAQYVTIRTSGYAVRVPTAGTSLTGVQVLNRAGALLYEFKGELPPSAYLPAPGQVFGAYVVADSPRIVPPAWGATPPPFGNRLNEATSGWDLANDAPDLYVFLDLGKGYRPLRENFLKLTGPVPLPPLFMFGFIDSRYHPYRQQEALDSIDAYRQRGIPLDTFVVDTDWRKGGSHGYAVDDRLFPNMPGFLSAAHQLHVKVMFNDHPEPVAPTATDPRELRYRWNGLTGLLKQGVDLWWYDRNWGTHIATPAEGLPLEVWGMRVYSDMTQRLRPQERPVIMSNVWGIDNGYRSRPTHPAAHRYPVWWTGDTSSQWRYLQMGVANGVDSGVLSLLPYVNEDLGGHIGMPTPELYVRYLQYGCLSPITRVHCMRGAVRYPWAFGPEAEKIVTEFIKLRYRLLPTIYAAARRAAEDGTPILRRCDLASPTVKGATDSSQYLLGDDILVAPVTDSVDGRLTPIPSNVLTTPDGQPGLKGEYFANESLSGNPALVRTDAGVNFAWDRTSPGPGMPNVSYSVRWTGKLGPAPETGDYNVTVRSDDGARLWVDGELLIDKWVPQDNLANSAKVRLQKGQTVDLKLEFVQFQGGAFCSLGWRLPSEVKALASRSVWVPPGLWEDVWTGKTLAGPRTVQVESPLWHMPLYVQRKALILTAPEMPYTGARPWDRLTVDAYPASHAETRELYEDDGHSQAYLTNGYRRTQLTALDHDGTVLATISPAKGTFAGAPSTRAWTVRLHLLPGRRPGPLQVNGRTIPWDKPGAVTARILLPERRVLGLGSMPFRGGGQRPGPGAGPIVEVSLPSAPVSKAWKVKLGAR